MATSLLSPVNIPSYRIFPIPTLERTMSSFRITSFAYYAPLQVDHQDAYSIRTNCSGHFQIGQYNSVLTIITSEEHWVGDILCSSVHWIIPCAYKSLPASAVSHFAYCTCTSANPLACSSLIPQFSEVPRHLGIHIFKMNFKKAPQYCCFIARAFLVFLSPTRQYYDNLFTK